MQALLRASVFLLAAILSGCGQPTIDGTNEDTFKESFKSMKEGLPDKKAKRLDTALMTITFSGFDLKTALSNDDDTNSESKKIWKRLDGMTAQEILAQAERIEIKNQIENKKQAVEDWQGLLEAKRKAEKARKKLKNFKIQEAEFRVKEKRFGSDQPVIDLTVVNNTDYPVSRAYFKGTVKAKGRSVPYIEEPFNYEIPGGIEHGEEATYNLAPNPYGDWGQVDVPDKAFLEVEVQKIDGADEEPIYDAGGLDEMEQSEIKAFNTKYGDIDALKSQIEKLKDKLNTSS